VSALVTGSSRGLGRAIAARLARDGHAVAVNGLGDEAHTVAAAIRAVGGSAEGFPADVTDERQATELATAVSERLGPIDVLVLNATGPQPDAPLHDVTWEDHLAQLDFFVKSPLLLGRAVLLGMRAQRSGRIVHVDSEVADRPPPGRSAYATAKSAQIGLTRAWARELAPLGITVNTVAPGFIPVERHAGVPDEEREAYRTTVPAGHLGTPEDVAHAVSFFASAAAGFVTGQRLVVDGGRSQLPKVAGDQQLVVRAQLGRRAVQDDLAVREHVAAVGDLERQLDVLLDQQHRAAALLRVAPDDRQQALDDDGREPEAELVQQQQARAAGERAGDGQHLLLAAGQQPDRPRLQRLQGREVLERLRRVERLAAVAQPEVLGDGQAEEQTAALGDVRDPAPRAALGRHPRRVLAVEQDPALERVHEPGHGPQRGRLARPVGAEQRDDLARGDLQLHLPDHGRAVVAGGQALEAQHGGHSASPSRSAPAFPR
jgi:3-oxoacyl-[acyl-carrier protein] reductase